MDLPPGPLPLSEADFLDFIFNYFKAEYAPIRWIFASTADAVPLQAKRFLAMGDHLSPTSFRPADPRAHADLQSLEYCIRKWNLDAAFVKGIVVRYAKYRVHERLEKKLYECLRGDLMVRKALKEKALIDRLWPSPAPANLPKELLQQGVQVRQWYGYMFFKYFRLLRAEDDFSFRPEVAQALKSAGTLMLVPFAEHISAGPVEPIRAIMANGASFVNAPKSRNREREARGFGEPEKFEIRFETPGDVQNTVARSVVRQCRCLKCGTLRDVQVAVLIDPTPGGVAPQGSQGTQRRPSNPNTSAPRRSNPSKTSQRYTPGYDMPGPQESAQRQALPPQVELHNASPGVRSPSSVQKKQCPACTFLNHPELKACEMCQSPLPETLTTKPASPVQRHTKPAHAHSVSLPANSRAEQMKKDERPGLLDKVNRYSLGLGSSLYSLAPFSVAQQQQQQQQATDQAPPPASNEPRVNGPLPGAPSGSDVPQEAETQTAAPLVPHRDRNVSPPAPAQAQTNEEEQAPPTTPPPLSCPEPSNFPEMTLMPLTPPPISTSSLRRPTPLGLPQNLMDDYVPVSPPVAHTAGNEDDAGWGAGWGEVSREQVRDNEQEEDEEKDKGIGMVDLDEVAREEMGVWGEREDE
ncbi:uncharacterized protein CC84DRAFT_1167595 [Paraphaeosphaeria sporulosa]|uniref:RanBP2-type domain-containing protein n=1 Tax=Paraphaeosphaeria sporulosa TaxID=1460663 RepID=A0A177C0Q3_9PLEO|nr:uncharacterized protein CC84DRAFT_1167595 [Paraphaeosphaeria sporulosa]OAG01374.1 hypothetical protein CC84DRAFT_1167595 [Paraphaeosphaeria sporulosa]